MRLVKLPFKMLALPIMLVLGVLELTMKLVMNFSCYIIGPFMLFLIGCGVYAIVMQLWSQATILSVLLLGCIMLLFGALWLIVFLEGIHEIIYLFIYS